jgi:hypothetical protein
VHRKNIYFTGTVHHAQLIYNEFYDLNNICKDFKTRSQILYREMDLHWMIDSGFN